MILWIIDFFTAGDRALQELAQMSPAELLELFKCADDIRLWAEGQDPCAND